MKKIVVPGELVSAERKRLGSNVFVAEGKVYSKVLGVSDDEGSEASVVSLRGKYVPQEEDTVIGVVSRVVFAGYGIDLNSFVDSFIPKSAMREDLKMGDVISAKVAYVSELREANIEFPRRLFNGEVFDVIPVRTPRLIGKNGSMLELLRRGTGCELLVGKNGRVWARGGDIALLKKVVAFVEENSYKHNLTNAIEAFFKAMGVDVSPREPLLQMGENGSNENESGARDDLDSSSQEPSFAPRNGFRSNRNGSDRGPRGNFRGNRGNFRGAQGFVGNQSFRGSNDFVGNQNFRETNEVRSNNSFKGNPVFGESQNAVNENKNWSENKKGNNFFEGELNE